MDRDGRSVVTRGVRSDSTSRQRECEARTQLVTGMLAAAMDSRFEQHKLVPTPHLNITYQPRDFRAMREMGASWKIITEDLPQPIGINPGGPRPR